MKNTLEYEGFILTVQLHSDDYLIGNIKKNKYFSVKDSPLVKKREIQDWNYPQSPSESDFSFLQKNKESAIWLLENSELFFELIIRYRRVIETVLEEKLY